MKNINPTLQELQRLLGDDAIKQILNAYLGSLADFESFLKGASYQKMDIKNQIHKMISPSISVGELNIVGICQRLEKAGAISANDRMAALTAITEARLRINSYLK